MKTCFKCKTEKERSEFYKHSQMGDGLLGKCKDCTKKDSHERHLVKLQDPEWAIKERKRQREKEERRRRAGKVKKYKQANSKRPKANIDLSNAVRTGKIQRKPCQVCGKEKAQGHHEDYSKSLDVVWLCTRHHADRHIYLRNQASLGLKPCKISTFIRNMKSQLTVKTTTGQHE